MRRILPILLLIVGLGVALSGCHHDPTAPPTTKTPPPPCDSYVVIDTTVTLKNLPTPVGTFARQGVADGQVQGHDCWVWGHFWASGRDRVVTLYGRIEFEEIVSDNTHGLLELNRGDGIEVLRLPVGYQFLEVLSDADDEIQYATTSVRTADHRPVTVEFGDFVTCTLELDKVGGIDLPGFSRLARLATHSVTLRVMRPTTCPG